MRIEAYTQVQQLYQANSKTIKADKKAKSGSSDQLQISSMGKDIHTVKQMLADTPDIREDVAAPLKSAIANGTYQVGEEDFAAKLYEKYEEMR